MPFTIIKADEDDAQLYLGGMAVKEFMEYARQRLARRRYWDDHKSAGDN